MGTTHKPSRSRSSSRLRYLCRAACTLGLQYPMTHVAQRCRRLWGLCLWRSQARPVFEKHPFLQKVLSLSKDRALALTRLVVCVKCMEPPSLQRPALSDSVCGAHVRHWKTNRVTVNGNIPELRLLDRFPAMSELI